jgi:putative membrane protein
LDLHIDLRSRGNDVAAFKHLFLSALLQVSAVMKTVEESVQRAEDDSAVGPSRRTVLAAERTWLAWWRTGIAVSGAAIAIGGLIPRLGSGSRTPYVVLGACYALLAAAIFACALMRHRDVIKALNNGEDVSSGEPFIVGLSIAGGLLGVATLIIIAVVD